MFARTGPVNKYNRRILNKRTRDFWGPDECCRRSKDQLYCKCPTPLDGIHPIEDGDYIRYSLDSEVGFLVDDNGMRRVNDIGNTLIDKGIGEHDGYMYSGISLTLGSDGYIDIPITTEQDSVTYFNASYMTFVQVYAVVGLPHIRLQAGTYGSIVKLTDTVFTQNDLDIFTRNPENVLRWKFGEDIGISIPVSDDHDVYAIIEYGEDYIHEVNYNQDTTKKIEIFGDYSWNKNVGYGLQTLRLEIEDILLPYNYIFNNGAQITNNGVNIINTI